MTTAYCDAVWLKVLARSDPYSVCRFSRTCSWAKNLVDSHIKTLPRTYITIRFAYSDDCDSDDSYYDYHTYYVCECPIEKWPFSKYIKFCNKGSELAAVGAGAKYIEAFDFIARLDLDDPESEGTIGHVIGLVEQSNGELYRIEMKSNWFCCELGPTSRDDCLSELKMLEKVARPFLCIENVKFDKTVAHDFAEIFKTKSQSLRLLATDLEASELLDILKVSMRSPDHQCCISLNVELPDVLRFYKRFKFFSRERGLIDFWREKGIEVTMGTDGDIFFIHFENGDGIFFKIFVDTESDIINDCPWR